MVTSRRAPSTMLVACVAVWVPGLWAESAATAPSRDATDVIAFATPLGGDARPLVTLVQTATRDGRVAPLCTVLGRARVQPVPVAGRVLVQAEPLRAGHDENDIPDGLPLTDETTWAVPLAGGAATPMPPDGSLSPSGQRYAFWRLDAAHEDRQLWVKSGEAERSTSLYRAADAGFLEWSPDEHLLAVGGFAEPGIRGQQMMVVETDTFRCLLECRRTDAATWSPDGKELAYLVWMDEADGVKSRELRVWNRGDGGGAVLARVPRRSYRLFWSPDGRKLLFGVSGWKTGEPLSDGVWVLEREGAAVRRLLDGAANAQPLAWTGAGEACWVCGRSGSPLVVGLQSAAAAPRLSVEKDAAGLTSMPAEAALDPVAGRVRQALAGVARVNHAVESFCEELAAPARELTQAEATLRSLPQECPAAGLLPGQLEQYAQAVALRRDELPTAACLVRMKWTGSLLASHFAEHNTLPPDDPAGLAKDPRYWVSPGTDAGHPYEIRYCLASGGIPRTDEVVLEAGPFGDRVVRLRWPEKVVLLSSGRYLCPPEPRVEALGR